MTSNSYGLFVPPPHIRQFEELHAERSYLLKNLQQENIKAMDLLRKLPPLEETLLVSQIAHTRRRARKQIGWLRYRIDEATRQEQSILNRLGQLAQEIQTRERWNRIEHEQRHHGGAFNSPGVLGYHMQQMYLSPTSPNLLLQEVPFPYVQQQQQGTEGFVWPQSYCDHVSEMPYEPWSPLTPHENLCPAENFGFDIQTRALATTSLHNTEAARRSCSMGTLDVKMLATNTPPPPAQRTRRHSTSSWKPLKVWPDCTELEGKRRSSISEEAQYSGYCIAYERTLG